MIKESKENELNSMVKEYRRSIRLKNCSAEELEIKKKEFLDVYRLYLSNMSRERIMDEWDCVRFELNPLIFNSEYKEEKKQSLKVI